MLNFPNFMASSGHDLTTDKNVLPSSGALASLSIAGDRRHVVTLLGGGMAERLY